MLMHVDVASDEDGDALVHRRVLADLMMDALRGRQEAISGNQARPGRPDDGCTQRPS